MTRSHGTFHLECTAHGIIVKYGYLSVSRISIICRGLRQITDELASVKSRYFAQPHPVIVNCVNFG